MRHYFHPNTSFRLFYPYLHKGSFFLNCFEFELLGVKPCWLVSWCFEPSQQGQEPCQFTLYQWRAERGFTNEEQKEALPMKSRKRLYQWTAERLYPWRAQRGFTHEEHKEALPMKSTKRLYPWRAERGFTNEGLCCIWYFCHTYQPSLHCHWCRLLGNNYSHVFRTFEHQFLTNRMWNRVKHCCVHILCSIAFETMHDACFSSPLNCYAMLTQTTGPQTTCPHRPPAHRPPAQRDASFEETAGSKTTFKWAKLSVIRQTHVNVNLWWNSSSFQTPLRCMSNT